MNHIHSKSGLVVSCTTDGFITDLPDLEHVKSGQFGEIYRTARKNLNPENDAILELKNTDSIGILSIKTRGQMGYNSQIAAFTGYQESLPKAVRIDLFDKVFDQDKKVDFIQFQLRSAGDILKASQDGGNGGSVTALYQEKQFSLTYDNRREIAEIGFNSRFMHSKPFYNVETCLLFRKIKLNATRTFNSNFPLTPTGNIGRKDKYEQILVKVLIRAFYHRPDLFGLDNSVTTINRTFIKNQLLLIDSSFSRVSLGYISDQKSKPFLTSAIPDVEKTRFLLGKTKEVFPLFDPALLLKS